MLCVCLQELFAAYDKDDSGTISFDELTEGLRAQGYVVNESEVGWRSAVDSEGILGYRSSWVCCMSGGGVRLRVLRHRAAWSMRARWVGGVQLTRRGY
jgi:hypothetical protein